MKYSQSKVLKYSPSLVYQVVADVSSYPQFVPGCRGVKLLSPHPGHSNMKNQIIFVQMEMGLHLMKERYISKVTLSENKFVEAKAVDSPLFSSLLSRWSFSSENNSESCLVDFFVDFEFRSSFYNHLMSFYLTHMASKTMEAFEKRIGLVQSTSAKISEPIVVENCNSSSNEPELILSSSEITLQSVTSSLSPFLSSSSSLSSPLPTSSSTPNTTTNMETSRNLAIPSSPSSSSNSFFSNSMPSPSSSDSSFSSSSSRFR